MWSYYRRLLRQTPCLVIESQDMMSNLFMFGALVVTTLLLTYNRELAQRFYEDANGISPWWAWAPLLTLLGYYLLRANYAEYDKMRRQRREARREVIALRRRVAAFEDTAPRLTVEPSIIDKTISHGQPMAPPERRRAVVLQLDVANLPRAV